MLLLNQILPPHRLFPLVSSLLMIVLMACGGGLRPLGYSAAASADAIESDFESSSIYSGQSYFRDLVFSFFDSLSNPLSLSGNAIVTSHGNSECTEELDANASFPDANRNFTGTSISFPAPSFSLNDSFERQAWLKFSLNGGEKTRCLGPLNLVHPFHEGVGYQLFQQGGAGAAGGTGAAKTDSIYRLKIDSTGRYVAAGVSVDTGGDRRLTLWRYLPDGSLDSAFGGGDGVAVFGGTGHPILTTMPMLAIDSDNRIIVASTGLNDQSGYELYIWRILPSGTEDSTFGTAGIVTFQHASASSPAAPGAAGATGAARRDFATEVKIDAQGRYLVVGNSLNTSGGTELALWRFLSDGSLDTAFASGAGYLTFQNNSTDATGASAASRSATVLHIHFDSNHKIIAPGYARNVAGKNEGVIWRFLDDGSLDTSFGSGTGYVIFQANGSSAAGAAAGDANKQDRFESSFIDSRGRYVMGSISTNSVGGQEFTVWRFLADGSLDTTFGDSNGVAIFRHATTGLGGAPANLQYDAPCSDCLAEDADGNIIAAGRFKPASDATVNGLSRSYLGLVKFQSNGTLDTTFGSGTGAVLVSNTTTGFSGGTGATLFDYSYSMVLDRFGRFVVAGTSKTSVGGYEAAIWRFNQDGSLDD